jgi:type I restriction enzyme S subunit
MITKEKKGYKQTNLGFIPKDWEVVTFNKIFERIIRKNTEYNKNSLTISAQHGLINQLLFFKKSVSAKDLSSYYLLEKGDFAYNKSYSNGYPMGVLKRLDKYEKGVVSTLYICFKIKSLDSYSDFYVYYFESGNFNNQIALIAKEGARAHGLLNVGINDFFNLYLIKPPLPEQKKIVEIISTWDKAISLKEELIKEKKLQKKYLMQELLTGNKRFKEFIKSNNYKQTELGLIPEDWTIKRFCDIGYVSSGGTPDTNNTSFWGGSISWCTPTDITLLKSKYLYKTNRTITELGLKNSSAIILPENSLIVCTRATIGYCAINKLPMSTNQGFKNIIFKKNIKVEFIYFMVILNRKKLIRIASGSTFLEVSKKDFEKITFPIPILQEQEKIASVLSTCDQEIELLEQELESLKEQKKGFMQLLLTGKVRVNINN